MFEITSRFEDEEETNNDDKMSKLAEAFGSNAWKKLYDQRIIYLRGAIEKTEADDIVAQLLALSAESDEDITFYINSPGGAITGMYAIYDVMRIIPAKVNTIAIGMAASAGAFLLSTATGKRKATPNTRIMIHQPLGGARGQSIDIKIQAKEIVHMRSNINRILAEVSGKSIATIETDTQRNFWLSAQEAKEYGLIDEVLVK